MLPSTGIFNSGDCVTNIFVDMIVDNFNRENNYTYTYIIVFDEEIIDLILFENNHVLLFKLNECIYILGCSYLIAIKDESFPEFYNTLSHENDKTSNRMHKFFK